MASKLHTMEFTNMDPPQNFFSFHSAQDQDHSGGQFDEAYCRLKNAICFVLFVIFNGSNYGICAFLLERVPTN